jgi:hypothetical protein
MRARTWYVIIGAVVLAVSLALSIGDRAPAAQSPALAIAQKLVKAGICANVQPLVASDGIEATCDSMSSGLELHVYATTTHRALVVQLRVERVGACTILTSPGSYRTYVVGRTWF